MMTIFSLTEGGYGLANKIQEGFGGQVVHKAKPFKDRVKKAFEEDEVLIFIMATGIVVRTIGPLCQHKSTDPCVLVLDEKAQNVISLLSGHIGNGNAWTHKVADFLGANPVITTASDVNDLLAIDMVAKKYRLVLEDFEGAKKVTQALVDGHGIQVLGCSYIQEKGYSSKEGQAVLYVGHDPFKHDKNWVRLRPKNLVLGLGCKKDTPSQKLRDFVYSSLDQAGYPLACIDLIASAWLKDQEEAILDLKEDLGVSYKTFSQEELVEVEDLFDGSDFVKGITGVRSVSEASGYLASNKGRQLIEIIRHEGMTLSLWERRGEPCYTS